MNTHPTPNQPPFIRLILKHVLEIPPYVPGKPIEEVEREFGIKNAVKLASNENPLGPSPKALEAVRKAMDGLHRYPDGSGIRVREALARRWNVDPDNVILGNGSDEIIELTMRIFMKPGGHLISPKPSFLMYEIAGRALGCEVTQVPLRDFTMDLEAMIDAIRDETRLLILCQPNNPTGTSARRKDFERFLERAPRHVPVLLDEAYGDFIRDPEAFHGRDYLDDTPQLIILRTFSKAYGLAGIRIGYGLAHRDLVACLNRVRPPFNTNSLAQAAALAALDDDDFLQETLELTWRGLDFLGESMDRLGFSWIPSQTNFMLIQVGNGRSAYEHLLRKGIIVRPMDGYGLPDYIRVNTGRPEENLRFVEGLKQTVQEGIVSPLREPCLVGSSRGG